MNGRVNSSVSELFLKTVKTHLSHILRPAKRYCDTFSKYNVLIDGTADGEVDLFLRGEHSFEEYQTVVCLFVYLLFILIHNILGDNEIPRCFLRDTECIWN